MSRVLLAIGDPNGIGPEIAVDAAARVVDPPVLVGDRHVLADLAAARGIRLREHAPGAPAEEGVLDLVDVGYLPPDEFRPGVLSAEAGAATIRYVTAAVTLALGGGYRAVVACPHSETAVHAA